MGIAAGGEVTPEVGRDLIGERPARIVAAERPARRPEDEHVAADRGPDRRRDRVQPAPFQRRPGQPLLHGDRLAECRGPLVGSAGRLVSELREGGVN